MNAVDAVGFRQRDNAIDVEIGLDGAEALTDQERLIGFEAVQTEAVLLRKNGHGAEAEFVGGAEDADGDLAAVEG